MAGKIKGVQARLKEKYPSADYFHCANHRVNLAATNAAAVKPISRLLGRVQDVIVYLSGKYFPFYSTFVCKFALDYR